MKISGTIKLLSSVLFFAAVSVGAQSIFECEFKAGKWSKDDFIQVKSSRWSYINGFRQEADHIVNICPADATEKEMLSKRAGETYAAMIYKNPIKGNCEIECEMSFDYRMAPSIVIAEKPGVSSNGFPEFRTHYEVVLFDEGINVWRHWFENGKQIWRKVGHLKARFFPNKKYDLKVDIKFTARGPMWDISCNDHEFSFIDDLLPKEYYVGIIGCEGVNRFYDLEIEK